MLFIDGMIGCIAQVVVQHGARGRFIIFADLRCFKLLRRVFQCLTFVTKPT